MEVKNFDLWWEVKPGHGHKKRCLIRKIWVKKGGIEHRGRPCKLWPLPPPPLALNQQSRTAPFHFAMRKPFKRFYAFKKYSVTHT